MGFENSGELINEFKKGLRNTEIDHDQFYIFFTGVPFSGKSTIAKVIQNQYDMVRIENDRLRELSHEHNIDIDVYNEIVKILKNHKFENGRIVQDSSIDRFSDQILPYLEQNNIPYFIIRMPIPEDMELRAREKMKNENMNPRFPDKFIEDHREALKDLEVDFHYGEDGDIIDLLNILDKKLA